MPVIVAGDLFDKWHQPPELISFAIAVLPERTHAVYGNHDLPYHSPAELKRSAYFTLMKAGKITNLEPGKPVEIADGLPIPLRLRGFPYGSELTPLRTKNGSGALCVDVAVVHRYCWIKGKGDHPKAKEEDRARSIIAALAGFDVILCGDNHAPFKVAPFSDGRTTLVNCGCLVPRSQPERTLEPSAWLVMQDGTVKRHRLDASKDEWLDPKDLLKADGSADNIDVERLVNELTNLRDASESFRAAIVQALDDANATEPVKRLVLGAMDNKPKRGNAR